MSQPWSTLEHRGISLTEPLYACFNVISTTRQKSVLLTEHRTHWRWHSITQHLTSHLPNQEQIIFLITNSPRLLGMPWLRQHDPTISWTEHTIVRWSTKCHATCPNLQPIHGNTTIVGGFIKFPAEYTDLKEVFSKMRATELPLQLLPGAAPPRGRINPLCPKEQKGHGKIHSGSFTTTIHCIIDFPCFCGVFFIEKKDGGLRPCIYYRGLNQVLVKYPYQLPRSRPLELLKEAKVFTKLDLRILSHPY